MKTMKKNSLDTYKEILKVIEKRSTCARLQVAALLVKDDRIISTGWNGVPSGQAHCCEVFHNYDVSEKELHGEFSRKNEIHSEVNAIGYAARAGVSTEGSTMFVSISPCAPCAKLIIAAGIKSVYYINDYDRDTEGTELLVKSGIEIKKLD